MWNGPSQRVDEDKHESREGFISDRFSAEGVRLPVRVPRDERSHGEVAVKEACERDEAQNDARDETRA